MQPEEQWQWLCCCWQLWCHQRLCCQWLCHWWRLCHHPQCSRKHQESGDNLPTLSSYGVEGKLHQVAPICLTSFSHPPSWVRSTRVCLWLLCRRKSKGKKSNPNYVSNSAKKLGIVLQAMPEVQESQGFKAVSDANAQKAAFDLYTEIYKWTWDNKLSLSSDDTNYNCYLTQKNRYDPFRHFYLTVKIHKSPVSTQPVCSDCASLVHLLRKWLNYALQPVVASQPFYFKD